MVTDKVSISYLLQWWRNSRNASVKIKVWKKQTENPSLWVLVEQVLVTFERQFAFVFFRLCQACRRPFNDPAVARYPNGVTTHIHCARNKTVCPVTGHVFSSLEHRDEAKDDGSWGSEYWHFSRTQAVGVWWVRRSFSLSEFAYIGLPTKSNGLGQQQLSLETASKR